MAKPIDNLKDRVKAVVKGQDKAGDFYRKFFFGLFAYVSNRIPEIADEVYKIDAAMDAGFGWEIGPFATWDALGVERTIKAMEEAGVKPAQWVYDMLQKGNESFFKVENGTKKYYDLKSGEYKIIPGTEDYIILDNYRTDDKIVWKNSGCTLLDIGDGIVCLEFHTKMNTIGGEVLEGINKAIDIAEKDYKGLVIGNEGQNFSAGANLGMVFMLAMEEEYDEINFAIDFFQKTAMRIRYSSIPVVLAPFNLTLGGGCELCLHADKVVAHAELYIGLVEVGVGVIPGGGGTKEFALRASDSYYEGDPELPTLQQRYITIAQAKVSTSAYEAFDNGILVEGRDEVVMNKSRLIAEAKRAAVELAEDGYTQPVKRKDIKVLGKMSMATFFTGVNAFTRAGYISEHDNLISQKLAYVISGGDLSQPQEVSEEYLLKLEREAFMQLLGQKKTLERIQSVLSTGKVLRN